MYIRTATPLSALLCSALAGNPEAFEAETKAHAPVDQHAALVELQRLAHDKMKNLLRTRTLRGFPLNLPFTDVEELLTRVHPAVVTCILHFAVFFKLTSVQSVKLSSDGSASKYKL